MSISSDIRKKEKDIAELTKHKKDLTDDSSDISSINKLVNELQEDLQKFIVSDNTRSIVDKISNCTEPYQGNDSDLKQSCNYIDSEISALRREIAALERAREAAAKAKAAISGIK